MNIKKKDLGSLAQDFSSVMQIPGILIPFAVVIVLYL